MPKQGPHPCDCAPEGSTLIYAGDGSGGKGQQWYFEKPDGTRSLGLAKKSHAEWWAREGLIKFTHPRQNRAQTQEQHA